MMSTNVKVRVLDGRGDHERSVVALSGISDQQRDEFASTIMEALGGELTIKHMESPDDLAAIADAYYDVRPPIDERMMRRFASKCLTHFDTSHNMVDVIDNTKTLPERRLQTAGTLVNSTR
jgi:hypothetical protein